MRTWILFSASVIAVAIRPEINQSEVLGYYMAFTWVCLLALGLYLDLREHVRRNR